MNTQQIISEIDAKIAQLQTARAAILQLSDTKVATKRGRPKGSTNKPTPAAKKRVLTPEGRARILAGLKKRWANKKPTKTSVK